MNWAYKLLALFLAFSLWAVVNFGSRTAVTLSKFVEIRGDSPEFIYKVYPERVEITVYMAERLLTSSITDHIKTYVDVSTLTKPGVYKRRVEVETDISLLLKPAAIEPKEVRVEVIKPPPAGR